MRAGSAYWGHFTAKSSEISTNGSDRSESARWRERLARGAAVYPVDGQLFDLMERFGELKDSKTGDRQAVATAVGKVLRRALAALLREEAAPGDS